MGMSTLEKRKINNIKMVLLNFCSMLNSIHGLVMFDVNLVYRLSPIVSRPCQSFKSQCLFIHVLVKDQETRLIRNCGI